jgi:hypothetical protein
MLKLQRSTERTGTTLLTCSLPFGEGAMAAKMPAKIQDKNSNVIAFPQAQRLRAIRCDDSTGVMVCAHCGGPLGRGESEDDCSSARISRSS